MAALIVNVCMVTIVYSGAGRAKLKIAYVADAGVTELLDTLLLQEKVDTRSDSDTHGHSHTLTHIKNSSYV